MQDFDSTTVVSKSGASNLLRLIELDETTRSEWQAADLAPMLTHQLNAALDFDLSGEAILSPTVIAALDDLPTAKDCGIETFGQLFLHPKPSIGLLKICKGFFKRIAGLHAKESPEHQVAYLCYLLSAVVANIRHGKKISSLKDTELLQAIGWGLKQSWVEASIRELLLEAQSNLQQR